ncbi:hypothetical protein [Algoriphagus winogradskyi]|uniref:Lipoprotein n=1 Tax=Algoriphagus winogradskyi TaxID=237017 RepID=A0ABY1PDB4_9BACT|nr:hypothetical protein [Algoriphagus winogradskyi]SMP31658.1 hypothetical protein SAMN06265367_107180 [Algoriphagus winogradskyi]
MKKYLPFLILVITGCSLFEETDLVDIQDIDGPCTIILTDGSSVVSNGNIEISKRTQAITYRDENNKIWSLFKNDYTSFTCE